MAQLEIVVWYEGGACTEFTAPSMSLHDGFVHEDNNIDWSNPDDGIYWERACVYISVSDSGRGRRNLPLVVDRLTGETIAEFPSLEKAQEYVGLMLAKGNDVELIEPRKEDNDELASESQLFHRRTRLISGLELTDAIAVEVGGKLVLVRDEENSPYDCGLRDVTAMAVGYVSTPTDEPEEIEVDDSADQGDTDPLDDFQDAGDFDDEDIL